jgi:hypothetical protein
MQRMALPAASRGSWEELLHRIHSGNKLLITRDAGAELRESGAGIARLESSISRSTNPAITFRRV